MTETSIAAAIAPDAALPDAASADADPAGGARRPGRALLLIAVASAGIAAVAGSALIGARGAAPTALTALEDTAFAPVGAAEGESWFAAMAELAEASDDYLIWADARYRRLRAERPDWDRLTAEHASILHEMRTRGLARP